MQNEIEFEKMNLKKDDILIIKVNTKDLTPEETIEKLSSVRNDEFVKFVGEKGHPVLVAYSGLDFQILRMEENDKVLVYLDVASMTEEEAEKYENYVRFKLSESIGDKLICVPVRENKIAVKVSKGVTKNG